MADTLSAEEHEFLGGLSRVVRLRAAPVALRVNRATGEAISPSGVLSDEDVARLEQLRREALERYRSA